MENCPYSAAMPRPSRNPSARPALGLHLAQLRRAAGLTQTELAEALGVPQSNIAFWEGGSKPPRSEVLAPMAKAFGVSVEALLNAPSSSSRKAKPTTQPRGQAQRLFAAVTKLPRSEQRRILSVLEALLAQSSSESTRAA
jgi:transcriptional regulator with XRE-family HTH domain